MTLESFEICLDNKERSYFAGQVVSGRVELKLSEKAKAIHGIKLKLQGKAKTHWKETGGRSTSHFSQEEIYLDDKIYLTGYETDSSEMTLDPGVYSYPFSFPLPLSLPSSYAHKYGQVKYYLEATISRHLKANYNSKLAFTVNGLLDLNKEPEELRSEGHMAREKNVCCFWCTSGPLGFELTTDKTGFVPGERVGFVVNMYNHSSRDVSCCRLALIQELTFTADLEKTKRKLVEVASVDGPTLARRGGSKEWVINPAASSLKIPPIPPSRLAGCSLIDISYHLKFKMEAKNATTLKERLPITIGTIPLGHGQSEKISGDEKDSTNELPPPSYEEATNGLKAEDADSSASDPPDYGSVGWKNFIPKYVTYRFK